MGLLRVYLALAVIVTHMGGRIGWFHPVDGPAAVQAFYIISGFYMSLVLSTKYGSTLRATVLFWQNRYLRLAPTYWLVMLAALTWMLLRERDGQLWTTLPIMSPGSVLFVIVANIAIVGQDVTSFIGFSPELGEHSFHFVSKIAHHANPLLWGGASRPGWHFLLVPQAWSVAVELMFYAVVPLLARLRSRWLLVLALTSLALRMCIYAAGFRHDPWTYRFFPTELFFFLSGMLSHRAYARFGWVRARWAWAPLAALVIAGGSRYVEPAFLAALPFLLPGVFDLTRRLKWDAKLAELSYPLYICHSLTLGPARHFGSLGPLVAIAASIVGAYAIVWVVEQPVNRLRQRRLAAVLALNTR